MFEGKSRRFWGDYGSISISVNVTDNVLANNREENMEDEEEPEMDNTDTEFEPPTILETMQAVETLRRFANSGIRILMI
ncbi:hypothetical protein QE152_g9338 [Popillia japonica]|uniref:Uncharacterized protein n=1 Tax=Popillia japonica TaxID=7064 RepID=A0AAW1LY21_POPJA